MLHVLNWLAATQQRKSITLLTYWIIFTSECRKPSNRVTVQMWSWQQQVTFTAQIKAVWWERSVTSTCTKTSKDIKEPTTEEIWKQNRSFSLFACMLQKTLQSYAIVLSGLSIACLFLLKASGHQIKLNSKQHIWPCSSLLRNYNAQSFTNTRRISP